MPHRCASCLNTLALMHSNMYALLHRHTCLRRPYNYIDSYIRLIYTGTRAHGCIHAHLHTHTPLLSSPHTRPCAHLHGSQATAAAGSHAPQRPPTGTWLQGRGLSGVQQPLLPPVVYPDPLQSSKRCCISPGLPNSAFPPCPGAATGRFLSTAAGWGLGTLTLVPGPPAPRSLWNPEQAARSPLLSRQSVGKADTGQDGKERAAAPVLFPPPPAITTGTKLPHPFSELPVPLPWPNCVALAGPRWWCQKCHTGEGTRGEGPHPCPAGTSCGSRLGHWQTQALLQCPLTPAGQRSPQTPLLLLPASCSTPPSTCVHAHV